jgi:predicted site-specific integrase-resolvase
MDQGMLVLPRMLSEKQAAQMLAVSVAALRRWRREGRGPQFTRLQRCIRYDVRAIEKFLAEHTSGDERATDSQFAAAT